MSHDLKKRILYFLGFGECSDCGRRLRIIKNIPKVTSKGYPVKQICYACWMKTYNMTPEEMAKATEESNANDRVE